MSSESDQSWDEFTFNFHSFVVPWCVSRRNHSLSVGCCSRALCGRARASRSSSSSRRSGA